MWKITALISLPLAQSGLCRQTRYRYIYLLWQQTYLHKDLLTKLNTARNILIYQHVWQADISNYNGVFWTSTPVLMCHLNMKTSRQTQQMICFYGFAGIHERGCAVKTWKQVHVNTESDAIFNSTKTPLYLSGCLLPPHLGCMVLPWGDSGQWSAVLLTGSVLNRNHMIATRCPGTRWTCHDADQNTNIMLVSFLYICAQGVSSGARAVKVYFWMYSLRSERLAVGARQLWRQHVIVARQPDRPKMAELTGRRFYTYTC